MMVNEHGVDPDLIAAEADSFNEDHGVDPGTEDWDDIEEVSEQEDSCSFEKPTGDERWPVLCDKDNQFASRDECDDCKAEMRRKREAR